MRELFVVTYCNTMVNTGIYKSFKRAVEAIRESGGIEHVIKVERLDGDGPPEDYTLRVKSAYREEGRK